MFLLGGLLAAFLAFVVFYLITKQTVLSPIRKLRELSDHVAEGDLTQRSDITTGGNPMMVRRHFEKGMEIIIDELKAMATPLEGQRKIAEVAESIC